MARLLSSESWSRKRHQVYSVEGADAVIKSKVTLGFIVRATRRLSREPEREKKYGMLSSHAS